MSVAHLDSQDAEDDEERAADEDDVADGPQGGDERLHDQLQPRRSAYHPAGAFKMHDGGCFYTPPPGASETPCAPQTSVPERAQRAQEAQDSEDAQDPVPAAVGQREEDVHQRHEHQQPVQDVPAGLEVGLIAEAETQGYDLREETFGRTVKA